MKLHGIGNGSKASVAPGFVVCMNMGFQHKIAVAVGNSALAAYFALELYVLGKVRRVLHLVGINRKAEIPLAFTFIENRRYIKLHIKNLCVLCMGNSPASYYYI